MSIRKFSHREEKLVDQMILDISQDISLPKSYADEARSIGWCTFLSIYQKHPASFQWDGHVGWTQVYQAIYANLSTLKTQEQSKYYALSLDQPACPESDTTLLAFLQAPQDDPHAAACFHDYMHRLPADERQLAELLTEGYPLETLPARLQCSKETLVQSYVRLQDSVKQYLKL